jgi:dipeptidase E
LKLLLTSAGVKNASIHDALVDLLGKPISESSALCIPTAMYGHPWVGPAPARRRGSSSADKNPAARCASWAGSPWECWS